MQACVPMCVLTGKLEVGLGGGYRCHGGGSSQSDRQKNSCSLKCQAGTHTYSLLGTVVTSHTRHPADLEEEDVLKVKAGVILHFYYCQKKHKDQKPTLCQYQHFLTSLLCLWYSITSPHCAIKKKIAEILCRSWCMCGRAFANKIINI